MQTALLQPGRVLSFIRSALEQRVFAGPKRSIARDSEEVDNKVELVVFVFFVEVSVALGFPKATRAHVETCLSLLQGYESGHEFVIGRNLLLTLLNDFLRG